MRKHLKNILPVAILALLIFGVYLSNVDKHLTLHWLREEGSKLSQFVQEHSFSSPLFFILIYIVSVLLIIPDSIILTLLGGLVFPFPLALFYCLFSEAVGATLFFAIFRSLFKFSFFKEKFPFIANYYKNFRKNEVSYLLFLRISHIFPFWITNLIASYFRVPFWTFIWTSFVGTVPLTFILIDAGRSLSKLFEENTMLTISDIFTLQIKIALIALSLLSLVPLLYRKFIRKK